MGRTIRIEEIVKGIWQEILAWGLLPRRKFLGYKDGQFTFGQASFSKVEQEDKFSLRVFENFEKGCDIRSEYLGVKPKVKTCFLPECQITENLKTCGNCHEVNYCSVDHQKEHYKVHKNNCSPKMNGCLFWTFVSAVFDERLNQALVLTVEKFEKAGFTVQLEYEGVVWEVCHIGLTSVVHENQKNYSMRIGESEINLVNRGHGYVANLCSVILEKHTTEIISDSRCIVIDMTGPKSGYNNTYGGYPLTARRAGDEVHFYPPKNYPESEVYSFCYDITCGDEITDAHEAREIAQSVFKKAIP